MSSLSGMRPGTGTWRMVLALVRQRRRLWLATFAVALSVGYLAGALTLLNRVSEGLHDLSSAGAEKADLIIEGDVAYESALEKTRRLIPSSIAESLIGQEGIAAVVPRVEDVVMLLGPDGGTLVSPGLSEQPLGSNWPSDPQMSPYEFVGKGRAPDAADEVVIDHRSAEKAGLSVGDSIGVVSRSGLGKFKIVGVVTTDQGDLPDGSSLALFTTEEARQLFQMAENDNRVAIRLEKGADAAEVESQIRSWLPSGSIVVDGETGATHRQESLTRSFTLIRVLIMGFAGLALVVGMVTVANSLTLLYSERRHSFATFRLVGAKRFQIMGAALTEAAMLAGVASILGAPLGLVLGWLIELVLGALGTSVPVAGSLLSVPALLTAVGVGALATVLAAVVPAWKACGVPAIEAVVESESGREAPYKQRLVSAGIVSVAVGVVALGFVKIAGLLAGSEIVVALGVTLAVFALSQLPTALAYAVALGIRVFPERSGALRRIGARDAVRNRTRTAATTGALMLATAVVAGLAVFLSSFASSLDDDVAGLVRADLVVDSGTFTVGGLPSGLVEKVAETKGVRSVSGWMLGRVYIDNLPVRVTGMDASAFTDILSPTWVGKAPKRLSKTGVAISDSVATQLGVELGSEIPIYFASQATVMMTVEGIYSTGEVLLGGAVVDRTLLAEQVPKSTDIWALVKLDKDSPKTRAAVTKLAKSFGAKSVIEPDQFVNSRSALLKGFERVIQWMLLFTLLQALIGVVNTLLLSVGERRREFGLLRAAGASRRQVLRLVLVEGGSFAVVGTALGLVVGVVGARVAIGALGRYGITGFTVPVPILVVTAFAASLLGIVAAVIPARWAAAVPPLEAVMDSGGDRTSGGPVRWVRTWLAERQRAQTVVPETLHVPPMATATGIPHTAAMSPTEVAAPVAGAAEFAATMDGREGATPPPFDPARVAAAQMSKPASPEMAESGIVDFEATKSRAAESEAASSGKVESGTVGSEMAESEMAESGMAESEAAVSGMAESEMAEPEMVESRAEGSGLADSAAAESEVTASWIKPKPEPRSHESDGRPRAGSAKSGTRSGTTSGTRSTRRDRASQVAAEGHVLFAPGGGMSPRPKPQVSPPNVPAVLEEALSGLLPQSVFDAAPVLPALAAALGPGESVRCLVQGWAKGLACVVARTDKRVLVVVNRFPEPLVESLHPTRTGISLYGPPGAGHVSVAIVDGRRLLEVSGVNDKAQAMALRTDVPRPPKRRGYF